MYIKKFIKTSYLILMLSMTINLGCSQNKTKDATPSVKNVKTDSIEILEFKLGPVSTFERTCARCHGPRGAFYGDEFAKLNDQELKKIVKQMMVGPSFLKPKAHEVEAMTAYHRALTAKEPFICITSYKINEETQTTTLSGEATQEAQIKIQSKDGVIELNSDEQGAWSSQQVQEIPFKLIVTGGEKTKELTLSQGQWTHSLK
jgi:cytochrome c553